MATATNFLLVLRNGPTGQTLSLSAFTGLTGL